MTADMFRRDVAQRQPHEVRMVAVIYETNLDEPLQRFSWHVNGCYGFEPTYRKALRQVRRCS